MLSQVLFVAAAVMAVGANEYPPGVDPALCPNYPFCDNLPVVTNPYLPIPYSVPGYPANVNPAACPNYPYCNEAAPFPVPVLPANVDPATCPNYPYCDVSYTSYRHA